MIRAEIVDERVAAALASAGVAMAEAGRRLSERMCEQQLRRERIEAHIRADRLLAETAVHAALVAYDIGFIDLVSRRREARLIEARALVTWGLHSVSPPRSYPAIARLLGERDHTTIIASHRKAIALRLGNPAFAAACRDLDRQLHRIMEVSDGHR